MQDTVKKKNKAIARKNREKQTDTYRAIEKWQENENERVSQTSRKTERLINGKMKIQRQK